MNIELHSSLQKHFGFVNFRPGQLEAIQNLLNGQHTLVVMPTGSGKSLVFQLAAQHLPGITLVISPLVALMKDQVDSLNRRGIAATFINSTLPTSEQNHRLKDFAAGKYRLVYVAPERLRSVQFLEAMKRQKCSLLAVDEAHCISEWGHDFRPDYLRIAQFRAVMGFPLTAALTATATPHVQDDIARILNLPKVRPVVTGFNRPNLVLEVRSIPDQTCRLKALQELLSDHGEGAAIVYTGTRRDAEEVAEFLRVVVGVPAEHYHAGLPTDERTRIQDMFMSGSLSMVAATNAFGMGIDRADVRQVIHYSLPGSLEAYYQEAGRAGRDERPAKAVLLYSPEDRALQEWFINSSELTGGDLNLLYNALRPFSDKQEFTRVENLSRLTGQYVIKVRVGLAELERAGMLERLGDQGLRFRVRLKTWNGTEIQRVVERIKLHQEHRRAQLSSMVAYAESNNCRRGIILKHFGDKGFPDADICCDNCLEHALQNKAPIPLHLSRPVTQHATQIEDVIIECVHSLSGRLPRSGVAKLLTGSDSERVKDFRDHPLFSILSEFNRSEVLDEVDRLITCGQLAQDQQGCVVLGKIDLKSYSKPIRSTKSVIQEIVAWGNSGSESAVLELIVYLQNHDGNIRRLAASALGKIRDNRATIPLIRLLEREVKPQVRQYAVKALGKVGDIRALNILVSIESDSGEKEYTRDAARNALRRLKYQA